MHADHSINSPLNTRFFLNLKGKGKIILLLLIAVTLFPRVIFAQGQNGVKLSAQAGFDGICKENHWIPIRVVMENQGQNIAGQLEVQIPGPGREATVYAQEVNLPGVSRKETFIHIFPDGFLSEITVRFVAQAAEIASQKLNITCVAPGDRLIGIISGSPSTFNQLTGSDPINGRAVVAFLQPDDLPEQANTLEALNVLVFSDIDTGLLSASQKEALSTWLLGGGQMIVTGGPGWQKTAAGLEEMLPLIPAGAQTLPHLDALNGFSGFPGNLTGPVVVAQGRLHRSAQVLVDQAGIPLVASKNSGIGRVFYLAFDPSLEPFRNWSGSQAFYARLLSNPQTAPSWIGGFQDWNAAANAISTFPGLELPSAGLIMGFLFIYVAAIGPANYFLLRSLKRRELAWISIPVLVVLFSLMAFLIGNQIRGARPVLNRLAIVQVWPGMGQARVNALLGVFSPRRDTFQLEIPSQYLAHSLPGNPMMARRGGWVFAKDEQGDTHIPDLRLDVSGLNAVVLEGTTTAPNFTGDLIFNLDNNGASLHGSITNQSDLVLQDAVLLTPGKVERLGDFRPNERRDLQIFLPTSGQATPGGTNISSSPRGAPVYYGGPIANNNTFYTDILGTGDFYRDEDIHRRYSLLSAALGYGMNTSGPGGGTYLAGWSTETPVDGTLGGEKFDRSDTTLYLVALNPELTVKPGTLQIPPGLFTWSVLDPGPMGNASPYDMHLNQGSFSLRFNLAQPVTFRSVESLTLHLESYSSQGPTGFDVYLWDFTTAGWKLLPVSNWGNHEIAAPQRYVGSGGEIRLQIENLGDFSPASIEKADFTLVVEH